ncbi:MAG: hypothetical protein HZA25_00485 [Candidatus Niyogibacteria bacterium]|nr:hypothetical protein [Candidatus Niyogibacteria bacterium]
MLWIAFAIAAYFLNAVTAVGDKFLLAKKLPSAAAYAFYTGVLGALVIFIAPWGLAWPGYPVFFIALISGIMFFGGMLAFFSVIRQGEVSRFVLLIDGLTPVFIFGSSYFLLAERLPAQSLYAFAALVLGGLLISYDPAVWTDDALANGNRRRWIEGFWVAVLAALLFAASFTTLKYVFDNQSFISGFIWARLGSLIGALLLLLSASVRREIFAAAGGFFSLRVGGLFLTNKVLAGAALVFIDYAIYLGSVTMVNAMQGVKYIFLLFLVLVLSRRYPHILEERFSGIDLAQKILATILIATGFIILTR